MPIKKSQFMEGRAARIPLARVNRRLAGADGAVQRKVVIALIFSILAVSLGGAAVLRYRTRPAASELTTAAPSPDPQRNFPPKIEEQATIDTAIKVPEKPAVGGGDLEKAEPASAIAIEKEPSKPELPALPTDRTGVAAPLAILQAPQTLEGTPFAKAPNTGSLEAPHPLEIAGSPLSAFAGGPVINQGFQSKLALIPLAHEAGCLADVKAVAAKSVITFDKGSAAVPFRQSQRLRDVAEAVLKCPDAKVDVAGHTDRSGEQRSNLELSWQRAEAAIAQIRQFGFKTEQFSPVGYSSTRPLTTNPQSDAQAQNRRVEFLLR